MAVSFTTKTSGSQAAAGSHATASFTPTTGKLLIAVCYYSGYSGTPTLSCSGLSLTWNEITNIRSSVAGVGRIYAFAALVSGSPTGAVTFTLSSSTAGALWFVVEVDGFSSTSTILQSPTNFADSGATTGSVNMAAFASNQNMAAMFLAHSNQNAVTQESGWAIPIDFANGANNRRLTMINRATSDNDTTPSGTWTTSSGYVAIAIEINGNVAVEVSESMTIAESTTAAAVDVAGVSESLAIVETVAVVVDATAVPVESMTIVESLNASIPFVAALSESLTIAESVAASSGSSTAPDETMTIVEELLVEGGAEYHYPFDGQGAGGGSNAGYIAAATSSSYEGYAETRDPTLLDGLQDAWEDVPDPITEAWSENQQATGDAPPLEELEVEAPEALGGTPRKAVKFMQKKRGLAALGDLLPNPTSGALGSGASTVAGYAAAKAGKMLMEKIDPQTPGLKKHGKVAAAAVATGVALLTATKVTSLRDKRGEIALGGLLAVLELASEAYGQKEVEVPVEHQTGLALVSGPGEDEE